ncbi:MAG TPA: Hsp20/alpha crystallin family protein [Anaerolineaceae bacterium]|jgi:HSP20 family protein|nr:Hsp20/alpha crystallin family protein [Anaerolineaceae bacterium]HQM65749.1 Hsp20/alpha crystallin family protein [Anaerolineaceae bacterium]
MANIELRRRYPRDVFGIEPYLDRLFDLDTSLWDLPVTSFPIDVIENDNEYLVRASVAGFDPEQLEITFENNTLTIKGEIKEENKDEQQGRYHIRERYAGTFYRSVSLPGMIDQNQISAETDNGVLTIHLPKKPEAQPKRIEVKPKSVKVIEEKKK